MKYLALIAIIALLCGCVGSNAGQNNTGPTATPTPGGNPPLGANWCPVGATQTQTTSSGVVQVTVVGTETIGGVQYCKSVYEGDSETGRVEGFWTPDGNKMITNVYGTDGAFQAKMVTDKTANTLKMYDADGKLMYEAPLES